MSNGPTIHIHTVPGKYLPQWRPKGAKKWRDVSRKCGTAYNALKAFPKLRIKSGTIRVLFVPPRDSYYGPHIVFEGSFK